MTARRQRMSAAEFDQLFQSVSNWGRWGPDDGRGTLNYITPRHVAAAAALVRTGQTVSLSLPLNTEPGPDNPRPAIHYMAQTHDTDTGLGEPRFALDFLGIEFHGDCHTHIDALCHPSYKGLLYNGKPASAVTSRGAIDARHHHAGGRAGGTGRAAGHGAAARGQVDRAGRGGDAGGA